MQGWASVAVAACVAAVVLRSGLSILQGFALLNLLFTVFAPQLNDVVHRVIWLGVQWLQLWFAQPDKRKKKKKVTRCTGKPRTDRGQSKP